MVTTKTIFVNTFHRLINMQQNGTRFLHRISILYMNLQNELKITSSHSNNNIMVVPLMNSSQDWPFRCPVIDCLLVCLFV